MFMYTYKMEMLNFESLSLQGITNNCGIVDNIITTIKKHFTNNFTLKGDELHADIITLCQKYYSTHSPENSIKVTLNCNEKDKYILIHINTLTKFRDQPETGWKIQTIFNGPEIIALIASKLGDISIDIMKFQQMINAYASNIMKRRIILDIFSKNTKITISDFNHEQEKSQFKLSIFLSFADVIIVT